MTFKIRVVRPFGPLRRVAGGALFSTGLEGGEAHALLCEWEPCDELFSFPGPAAWFTAEPRTNPAVGVKANPGQVAALLRARPEQLLYPAHPDTRYRVPHITHRLVQGELPFSEYEAPRKARVAALVRNSGGPGVGLSPDLAMRHRFATAPGVDLYGPGWAWSLSRRMRWLSRFLPRSYRGEAEEAYLAQGLGTTLPDSYWPYNRVKVALFSRYQAAICLENTVEPYYFSEKFVDAVLAGCVPVYQAHETLRNGVLKGACWVDPSDFGMSPRKTFRAALRMDRREVAEQNRAWLESGPVTATEEDRVWARTAEILRNEWVRRK